MRTASRIALAAAFVLVAGSASAQTKYYSRQKLLITGVAAQAAPSNGAKCGAFATGSYPGSWSSGTMEISSGGSFASTSSAADAIAAKSRCDAMPKTNGASAFPHSCYYYTFNGTGYVTYMHATSANPTYQPSAEKVQVAMCSAA